MRTTNDVADYFTNHRVDGYTLRQRFDAIVDSLDSARAKRRIRFKLPSFSALAKAVQRYKPIRVHGNSALSAVDETTLLSTFGAMSRSQQAVKLSRAASFASAVLGKSVSRKTVARFVKQNKDVLKVKQAKTLQTERCSAEIKNLVEKHVTEVGEVMKEVDMALMSDEFSIHQVRMNYIDFDD